MPDSSERECPNREYCLQHEDNTKTLIQLDAQWNLVRWFGLIGVGTLISFCVWQYEQLDTLENIAMSIDKTVVAFVETTAEYRQRIDDRLTGIIVRQQDYEKRLRELEKK